MVRGALGLLVACGSGVPTPTAPPVLHPAGVVEGFYGDPWSHGQRLALIDVAVESGLDTWVYAPKADPYHRDRWREPYPEAELARFRELAERPGIDLVYALAPGLDFDRDGADADLVVQKLLALHDHGVRHFCVLFDDVFGAVDAANPEVQVALLRRVRADLPRDSSLCFVSNAYAGTAAQLASGTSPFDPLFSHESSELYAAYADLDPSIPMMWTGPAVFSREVTADEVRAVAALAGRPVWLWDNFPVNDGVLVDELFLDAVPARPDEALDGVLINPMRQPALSALAIRTLGARRRGGYDPAAALADALAALAPEAVTELGLLATAFASHPFLDQEAESAAFDAAWRAGDDATVDQLLAAYAALDPAVVADPTLRAEVDGPMRKLALYGRAGQAARSGDVAGAEALLAEARLIRWRVGENFGGAASGLIADGPPNERDSFGEFFAATLGR